MKLTDEEWAALRGAVADDDEPRFRAVIRQLVSQGIAEHRAVVERRVPFLRNGKPFFVFDR